MNEILIQALTQWGAAGLIAIAAGYIVYDSYKKTKEIEKWLRDQFAASKEQRSGTNSNLTTLSNNIDKLRVENEEFRKEISDRVSIVEQKLDKHTTHSGSLHLNAISQIAPTIHTIINDGLSSCSCDHIAVALLHNGSKALGGIPYIKFGFVAEKYNPIKHPQDSDLVSKYRDDDVTTHNRLPACIVQYPQIEFDLTKGDCQLSSIDPIVYSNCIKIGIKHIAFEAIRDSHGETTGFVTIYKFSEDPLDMKSLHSTTSTIEHLYQNLMVSLNEV
jgi:regulator of replication initiation timing